MGRSVLSFRIERLFRGEMGRLVFKEEEGSCRLRLVGSRPLELFFRGRGRWRLLDAGAVVLLLENIFM